MRGDAFACPDSLAFDPSGRLWICTDVGSRDLGKGVMAGLGNNQMLACDLAQRRGAALHDRPRWAASWPA